MKPDREKEEKRKSSHRHEAGKGMKPRKRRKGSYSKKASPLDTLLKTVQQSSITIELVSKAINRLGLKLKLNQISLLTNHLLLVLELNQKTNLVSRVNINHVLLTSLWESLSAVVQPDWMECSNPDLLDLGSGGGFPGIPLAIVLPELRVTLLDSRRAKILALMQILEELQIPNVEVIHDRAESLMEHDPQRYDIVTVRAVGSLKETTPWASRLLKPKGRMLAWKGPEGLRELRSLPDNEWRLINRLPVQPHRSIMVLERCE